MTFNFEGWKAWVLILFLIGGGFYAGHKSIPKGVCTQQPATAGVGNL